MKFTKMHGTGNSYIYVNCFEETVAEPEKLAVKVSDINFGIGADGLILICPSDIADVKMRMFNADGSQSNMCGNGIRCVGKYAFDHGLCQSESMTVETLSGVKALDLIVKDGVVNGARVNMGKPMLCPQEIPMKADGDTFINRKIVVDGKDYMATAVSMGNPHCVVYCDDVDSLNLAEIGPAFENSPLFPQRINAEFVQVISENEVRMRVWERGSGETLACGTGACAVAVSGVLNGFGAREITVHLRGGDLVCSWNEGDGCVYMTGGAEYICRGKLCSQQGSALHPQGILP
ncbi:MAG: diaminopimelate epimerase [Christensenellales bacterium]